MKQGHKLKLIIEYKILSSFLTTMCQFSFNCTIVSYSCKNICPKLFNDKTVLKNYVKTSQEARVITAQKMTFFIQDFFIKCDQIRKNLRIRSNVLKKSLMENFIFLCSGWSSFPEKLQGAPSIKNDSVAGSFLLALRHFLE